MSIETILMPNKCIKKNIHKLQLCHILSKTKLTFKLFSVLGGIAKWKKLKVVLFAFSLYNIKNHFISYYHCK